MLTPPSSTAPLAPVPPAPEVLTVPDDATPLPAPEPEPVVALPLVPVAPVVETDPVPAPLVTLVPLGAIDPDSLEPDGVPDGGDVLAHATRQVDPAAMAAVHGDRSTFIDG